MRAILGLAWVVSLVLFAAACGSNDNEDLSSETPSPAVASTRSSLTPTPSPKRQTESPTPTLPTSPVQTPDPTLLNDLAINRTKWADSTIENYKFRFQLACFCYYGDMPWTMFVRGGDLQTIADAGGALITPGQSVEYIERTYSTVELLFAWAEKAIREGSGVDVSYDQAYGFPTKVDVGTFGPTDTGSQVKITDFEVLP